MTPAACALKVAVRLSIHDGGGIDPTAALLRLGRAQLGRFHASDDPALPSLGYVPALEAAAGHPRITGALAALHGCALVPLAAEPSAGSLAQHLARIGRESGEVFAEAAAALADQHVTAAESVVLVRQLLELEQAARDARAALTAP